LNRIFKIAALAAVLIFNLSEVSLAQFSLNAENMALGGGGTSYLTGYETLFINPANLHIHEEAYSLQISAMQSSVYSEYLLPETDFSTRSDQLYSVFLPYKSADPSLSMTEADRNTILGRNFPGNRSVAAFQSMTDHHWVGLKWKGEKRSYGAAFRTRIFSKFELGRGYFSDEPVERGNRLITDRSFRHQFQSMHEISFGYAESFDFLNGLSPQLSDFIIGIAPKIVIAGASVDAAYENIYNYDSETDQTDRSYQYNQQATGVFSENQPYFFQDQPIDFVEGSFSDLLKPSGLGLGLDVGITYLITFGGDLSVVQRETTPTEKSLRLSFSITDIGAIYQFEQPEEITTEKVEDTVDELPSVSDRQFTGAPFEHLFFLDAQEDSPFNLSPEFSDDSYYSMLPTSVQAGALFQINRMKVMGDVRFPVVSHQFASKAPIVNLGTELKPLSFLPVRLGTRIAPHLPGYYSIGIGFEHRYFEIHTALTVKSSQIGPTNEVVGGSLGTIKINLP